jgi:hypothetical protein
MRSPASDLQPEDEDSMVLQNVGTLTHHYTASEHRIPQLTFTFSSGEITVVATCRSLHSKKSAVCASSHE